jgi:ribosomal protein S18 acetylase RimI-like enzyme
MTIVETTVDKIFENSHLFDNYYNEGKVSLVPDMNPSKDTYLQLESTGMFRSIGVFDGDKMVGFSMFYTSIMPHYSKLATTIESIYIEKEYRKYGTGKKLVDKITEISKESGAVNMFMSAPINSSLDLVASSFGFTATNTIYIKSLV